MSPLSPCQQEALRILQGDSENIFLTGGAGTGKSYLIQEFLKIKGNKAFPVLASTGAAAVLIGGRTFHSFFALGVMEGGVEKTIARACADRNLARRLKKIQGFVLDEISMISGATLSAAETISRKILKKDLPWGGLRVIGVGDFAQLPPVSSESGNKDWAFLEEVWGSTDFRTIVLKTLLRSRDKEFLGILKKIREGTVDEEVRRYLEARTLIDEVEGEATCLFPRRRQVEIYNERRLKEIDAPLTQISTHYSGSLPAQEQLKRVAPILDKLSLKVGALVMTRVNDPKQRYINGSVGSVLEITPEGIYVRFSDKREVKIEKTAFSLLSPEGEILATAINFPLNLAYALTIHKAQGATLDHIVADLRGLWEPGHAYVALSRLREGRGLTLTGWDEASVRTDPQVVAFYQSL